jgi:hypothetical protein
MRKRMLAAGLVGMIASVGMIFAESSLDTGDQDRTREIARNLDEWVKRAAVLPMAVAAHHRAGGRMEPFLIELLFSTPSKDTFGVYMAYDQRKASDPDSMLWYDRKHFPARTIVRYDFHAPEWDWYSGPKRTGQTYITDAYFDAGGSDIPMVSVTRPVLDARGRFIGVAGADLSLADIRERLRSWGAGAALYVVSKSGRILAHPDARLMLGANNPGARVKQLPGGDEVARQEAGTALASGHRLAWSTAALTGWKVVLSRPTGR